MIGFYKAIALRLQSKVVIEDVLMKSQKSYLFSLLTKGSFPDDPGIYLLSERVVLKS